MAVSSSAEPQWILSPIFLGFDCLQCFHYAPRVKAGEFTRGTVSPRVTFRNLEYPSPCISGYSASPLEVRGHTPWRGVAIANLSCQFGCLERKPKHKPSRWAFLGRGGIFLILLFEAVRPTLKMACPSGTRRDQRAWKKEAAFRLLAFAVIGKSTCLPVAAYFPNSRTDFLSRFHVDRGPAAPPGTL